MHILLILSKMSVPFLNMAAFTRNVQDTEWPFMREVLVRNYSLTHSFAYHRLDVIELAVQFTLQRCVCLCVAATKKCLIIGLHRESVYCDG